MALVLHCEVGHGVHGSQRGQDKVISAVERTFREPGGVCTPRDKSPVVERAPGPPWVMVSRRSPRCAHKSERAASIGTRYDGRVKRSVVRLSKQLMIIAGTTDAFGITLLPVANDAHMFRTVSVTLSGANEQWM